MRRFALIAALVLISASPLLTSYAPPKGWALSEDREIGGGDNRIWRRGDSTIRRYVSFAPFRPHSAADIRQRFKEPAVLPGEQLIVDSVVREPVCRTEKESWAIRYRHIGFEHASVLAVLVFATDYGVILNYSHPLGEKADAAAERSLFAYCAPDDTPVAAATAIPAQAPPPSTVVDDNGSVHLNGFSYTSPPGWHLSPIHSTMMQPGIGKIDLIVWNRRDDTIILSVLETTQTRVLPLDPQRIKSGLKAFAQDVSVVAAPGCGDRPIVIAEFKRFHPTLARPFEKQARYITQVSINGETNYATLEYRRNAPASDAQFMRSIDGLCFHAISEIGQYNANQSLERIAK